MWSIELPERRTPWSVGKVPKERGEQIGTCSGYVRISTIILGHPHYSSFTSYTPPPCNHPTCHGIAPSLHRLYPQRCLPLPCYFSCGHALLLFWWCFIAIPSSTLFTSSPSPHLFTFVVCWLLCWLVDTIICQVAIHHYPLPPPSPVHCLIVMLLFVAAVVIIVHHPLSLLAIKVYCYFLDKA